MFFARPAYFCVETRSPSDPTPSTVLGVGWHLLPRSDASGFLEALHARTTHHDGSVGLVTWMGLLFLGRRRASNIWASLY